MSDINIDGHNIKITNPEKILWPKLNLTKLNYIKYLIDIAPFILPHTEDKILTMIRYPNGVSKKSFYQKHMPEKAPEFVDSIKINDDIFINLNKIQTLIWLGNMAVIEFHITFNIYNKDTITSLVFDLDPSENQNFNDAAECALLIYEQLKKIGVKSYPKTSGSSGLQIYIPTKKYTYEKGRVLNTFFAKYFIEKFPSKMTIERLKRNRKGLLYFDYLQMWRGKNIIAPYSLRGKESASVSAPVTWEELKSGISPCDFNITSLPERINTHGNLFSAMIKGDKDNCIFLDKILK